MADKVIFELVRNSKSLLTLIKQNGDTIFSSRVFDIFIADKLPYESNFIKMIQHADELASMQLFNKDNYTINPSKFPLQIKFSDNNTIELKINSHIKFEGEDCILLEIIQQEKHLDKFVKSYINSGNLFVNNKIPQLIFSIQNDKIIALNKATQDFIDSNNIKNNRASEVLKYSINKVVRLAKIGGTSSLKTEIKIAERKMLINLDCINIDVDFNYFLISFRDNTAKERKNEILTLDKKRAHNIIDVIPGILFEFEVKNNKLKFTYISENIKELIGLSAKHILKDSNKLFNSLNKHERARLHYFFTVLTEDERKVRNEFMIINHEKRTKWITINWHETHAEKSNFKGTGYIDDITEKKKIQLKKTENLRRKSLKEFFTINLLKQSSIPSLLNDLSKTVVKKLRLQDLAIYIYNPKTKKLEYASSYSDKNSDGNRITYPKEISIDKGIIGRVVKSQKSELINSSSKDKDYYFIDKPSESELTVPIIFEGELLGVIDSEHVKPNFFTQEHLTLLNDISELLAVRLIQKKRQDDNMKYHSVLKLLYKYGEIFDFSFDLRTKKFNDSCIDNIIDLIGIKKPSDKIKIYNNSKIILNYILKYDIDILSNIEENLEHSIVETKETIFRIITELGYVKWLKVIISKIIKDEKGNITTIEGIVKDISKLKELENKIEQNTQN